jgi:hypothetical protein
VIGAGVLLLLSLRTPSPTDQPETGGPT